MIIKGKDRLRDRDEIINDPLESERARKRCYLGTKSTLCGCTLIDYELPS